MIAAVLRLAPTDPSAVRVCKLWFWFSDSIPVLLSHVTPTSSAIDDADVLLGVEEPDPGKDDLDICRVSICRVGGFFAASS